MENILQYNQEGFRNCLGECNKEINDMCINNDYITSNQIGEILGFSTLQSIVIGFERECYEMIEE